MRKCSVEGCEGKHHSFGFCRKHSWRFQQNGSPEVSRYKRHGQDKKAYNAWYQMIQRCTNPESSSFDRYGARGIKVCDRWMDFDKFYEDMGASNGLTLDRRDNDGDYCKSNCRWATRAVQQRNNSRTRLTEKIVADIRAMYAAGSLQKEIAKKYGIKDSYVSQIVNMRIWR